MNKKQIIIEIFSKTMTQFNYDEFAKTHPKLLKSIESVMEVASIQGQMSQMPGIDPKALKRRIDFKN